MATPSIPSSSSPSRWDRVKAAFREANEAESKKSTGEHLKDQAVMGAYFVKGLGKSALQILESGIKTSPPVMTYEGLKPAAQEIKKAATNYEGWKAEKKAEWQSDKERMKKNWEEIKHIHQHPIQTLKQDWEIIKDFSADQTIKLAKTPLAKIAEGSGVITGHVAFAAVGGLSSQAPKAVETMNVVERSLILSEGLTDQAMLQGAFKAMVPTSGTVTTTQSALKLTQVMESSILRNSLNLERVSAATAQLADGVSESIRLNYDPSNKSWTTPAGLRYNTMKSGENRIQHVLEHLEPNPFKKTHTVFNCQKNEVLSLVDEAWTATEKVLLERAPNGYDIYSVDMNRVIGTQNETIIKIITKSGSSEIVTAYPVK